MSPTFRNRLADQLSTFRWYYFVFPSIAMVLSSTIFNVALSVVNIPELNAASPIFVFLFLGLISFG